MIPAHPVTTISDSPTSSTGRLESWILVLTIAGYPIVAAVSQLMGVENRPLSIGMRTLLLVICLIVLVKFHFTQISRRNILFWAAWWFFWMAYLFRLASDTLFAPVELPSANAEYWFFAVGTCLIPAIAASRGNTIGAIQHAAGKLYWLMVVGASLNLIVMTQQHVIGEIGTLRAETEVLNPITLGHLGVSIILLSIWKLSEHKTITATRQISIYICCAIAAFTIFISASKGPLISLIIATAAYAIIRPRKLFSRYFIASCLLLLVVIAFNFDTFQNSFIIARISEGVFSDGARIDLISEAFRLIEISPIAGTGIEPLETYPHNLIIESFLVFGLLTGIPFCTMLVCSFTRIGLLAANGATFWVSLLFVQYFVAAMFSGSLYRSYVFWVLMVLVIAQPVHSEKPR